MTRLKNVVPVQTKNAQYPLGLTEDLQSVVGALLLSTNAGIRFGVGTQIVGKILNEAIVEISPLKIELKLSDSFDLKAFAYEVSNHFYSEFIATTGKRASPQSLGDRTQLTPAEIADLKKRALTSSSASQLIKGIFDAADVDEGKRKDLISSVLDRIVKKMAEDVFSMSRLMNQSVLDNASYTDELTKASDGITFDALSSLYESVVHIHKEVMDRLPLSVQAGRMLALRSNPVLKLCQLIKTGSQKSSGHEVRITEVLELMGVNLPTKEFKVMDHRWRVMKNNRVDAFDIRHVFSAASKLEDLVLGTHSKSLTKDVSELTIDAIKRMLNDFNTPMSVGYYAVNDATGIAVTDRLIVVLFQYFLLRRSSEDVTGRFYSAIVQLPAWGEITRSADLAPSVMKNLKDLDRCIQAIYDVYSFCRSYLLRFKDYGVIANPDINLTGDVKMTSYSKGTAKLDVNAGRAQVELVDFTELENLLLIMDTKHAILKSQNSPSVEDYAYMRSFSALLEHSHPVMNSGAHYENLLLGPAVKVKPEIYFLDPATGVLGGASPMFNKIVVHPNSENKPRAFYSQTYEYIKPLSMGGVRLNMLVSEEVDLGELDQTKSLFLIPFSTTTQTKLESRIVGSVLPARYWSADDGVNLIDSIRCAATKGFFGELTSFTSMQELREYYIIPDDLFEGIPVTESSTVADLLADPLTTKDIKEYLEAFLDPENVLVYLNDQRHTFYPDKVLTQYVYKRVEATSNMMRIFAYSYYPVVSTTSFVLDKVTMMIQEMTEGAMKMLSMKEKERGSYLDSKSRGNFIEQGGGRKDKKLSGQKGGFKIDSDQGKVPDEESDNPPIKGGKI